MGWTGAPILDFEVDSIPLDPVSSNRQSKSASVQESEDGSDDGRMPQVQIEDFSEMVECKQMEFNEPESFQFREAFETGREQAHEDRAFAEGYEYGATEAEANWELEHQIAAPYSLESEVDSVLSEREAAHSEAESVISGEREVARSESEEEDGRWHDDDDRETLEGVPRVLTVVITPP